MNANKRLFIQALLWFFVWFVLWVDRNNPYLYFSEHIFAYLLQVVLIAGLIWGTAPKLLSTKKYFAFVVVSIGLIVIGAYLSSFIEFGPAVNRFNPNRRLDNLPRVRKPPSKFFIHMLMLALAYSVATIIESFVLINSREQEVIKNKNENLQTELKLLKSQINPHFLFNALNNIYALSVIDSAKTQESIHDLSNMLRYVLYDCEQPLVTLEKEIAYIEDYIRLFSLKSSAAFDIDFKQDVEQSDILIAPMLLIPFVENAFKHGNIENRESGYLTVDIKANQKNIYFKVDNSLSKTLKQKDIVGGIGLVNVKKRLDILYPGAHDLHIQERPDTYRIELNIRLDA